MYSVSAQVLGYRGYGSLPQDKTGKRKIPMCWESHDANPGKKICWGIVFLYSLRVHASGVHVRIHNISFLLMNWYVFSVKYSKAFKLKLKVDRLQTVLWPLGYNQNVGIRFRVAYCHTASYPVLHKWCSKLWHVISSLKCWDMNSLHTCGGLWINEKIWELWCNTTLGNLAYACLGQSFTSTGLLPAGGSQEVLFASSNK